MGNIKYLSRVRQQTETGLWLVEILSSIDGYGWICKGEWSTEQEAQEDRKNWF